MFRIIARCDIKGMNLIKGIRYEGVRVLGQPGDFAQQYYKEGIDEIIYIDSVASLYDRNSLIHLIEESVKNIFVPISAGGGIKNLEGARSILKAGAEKVIINSAAILNPNIIKILSDEFGSQCIVISIQAKKRTGFWEAFSHCGRIASGLNVSRWIETVQNLGAGEILLTSIDSDGTMNGLDLNLINSITGLTDIPIIISGGFCSEDPIVDIAREGKVAGIAIGMALHRKKIDLSMIKERLVQNNIKIRI